jgi:hypothetical protein
MSFPQSEMFKYQKVSMYIMASGKMVHLRIPGNVYADLEKAEKSLCFDSVQNLIKDLLRNFVLEMHRKEALEWLEEHKGSVKGPIKPLSSKEREELLKRYLKEDTSDVFRKYGL